MLAASGIFEKDTEFGQQEKDIAQSAIRILLGCVASGDKEVSDVDMLPVTMRPQHIDLFISRAGQTGTQRGSLVYQTPSRMHECVEESGDMSIANP